MFVSWSFFESYIFFFFFQIALSSAIGAGLAFFSRIRGGRVHSLRWAQQTGLFEILKLLKQSRTKKLADPKGIYLISVGIFFLLILVTVVDLGARSLVQESRQGIHPFQVLAKTIQYIVAGTGGNVILTGWSTSLRYNADLDDALTIMLNQTRNIPSYENGLMYTPKKYPFEVECDAFDFSTSNRHASDYPNWWMPNNGCAVLSVFYLGSFDANYTLSKTVPKPTSSDGSRRSKMILPGTNEAQNTTLFDSGLLAAEINTFVDITYGRDFQCGTARLHPNTFIYNATGLSSAPETVATKCLFPTGEAISVAYSSISFSVPKLDSYANVTASIFKDPNELVQAMQDSIVDGTLTQFTADPLSAVSVLEVKISNGTNINVLMCNSRKNLQPAILGYDSKDYGTIYLVCTYTSASAIISKSQPMLPEIVALRGQNKSFPVQANITTTTVIRHLPQSSATKDSVYSIPGILVAPVITAKYLADLGQNFFIDWNDNGVYILYNAAVLTDGYEIPTWLFWFVIVFTVFGAIFWLATQKVLDYRFKGSLHWAVGAEVFEPTMAPRLMKFLPRMVGCEGVSTVKTNNNDPVNNNDGNMNMNLKEEYNETGGDERGELYEMSGRNANQSTDH